MVKRWSIVMGQEPQKYITLLLPRLRTGFHPYPHRMIEIAFLRGLLKISFSPGHLPTQRTFVSLQSRLQSINVQFDHPTIQDWMNEIILQYLGYSTIWLNANPLSFSAEQPPDLVCCPWQFSIQKIIREGQIHSSGYFTLCYSWVETVLHFIG